MRRPLRRVWLRGWSARNTRPSGHRAAISFLLAVSLGVGLALVVIRTFDDRVRPVMTDLALAKVNYAVTRIVDSAVSDTLTADAIAYGDIITLQTDHSGRITALTSNSAEMNRLRTEIMEEVIQQIELLDTADLGVPLGNLSGLSTLSGQGPLLPVRVLSVGTAQAAFRNVFSDAGINQTWHQVMLDVTVDVKLLIPGNTVETAVTTQMIVAETVIVGQVPDAYLQFEGVN